MGFKDSYTAGSCAAKGYVKRCELRYKMALWYKTDAECKAAQDKALHRRLAGNCYRISGNSCHQASEQSACSTFADSYTTGTCTSAGYGVACELRYSIIENYKTQAECDAARDHALHRRASNCPQAKCA